MKFEIINLKYKLYNRTVNKFLSAGETFMSELSLRQPVFTYSACGTFTKHQKSSKIKENR